MGNVLSSMPITTLLEFIVFFMCSSNNKSLVENTPRSFTVVFIVIGSSEDDLYSSTLTSFVLPCTICSNFFELNSILLVLAQSYIDPRSSCILTLSSLHITFLLTLVSSAKLLSIHNFTFSSISEIIITNNIAAKTIPCSTPDITFPSSDIHPFTTTLNFLSIRNFLIHFPILLLILCFFLPFLVRSHDLPYQTPWRSPD